MLTRNFMFMLANSSGMALDDKPASVTNINGETSSSLSFGTGSGSSVPFSSQFWKNSKFVLGKGTTPAKSSDYALDSEIALAYDCSVLTKKYVSDATNDRINIFGIVLNPITEPITIKEIGWVVTISNDNTFLLAREVLEEPITIEPGKSVAINVNLM